MNIYIYIHVSLLTICLLYMCGEKTYIYIYIYYIGVKYKSVNCSKYEPTYGSVLWIAKYELTCSSAGSPSGGHPSTPETHRVLQSTNKKGSTARIQEGINSKGNISDI